MAPWQLSWKSVLHFFCWTESPIHLVIMWAIQGQSGPLVLSLTPSPANNCICSVCFHIVCPFFCLMIYFLFYLMAGHLISHVYWHFLAHQSQRLKVSYCDHPLSIIIVVFFVYLSEQTNGHIIGVVHGTSLFSLYICLENFKNVLVRNHWTDFNTSIPCSFSDPLPRLSSCHDSSKSMAAWGRGLFSLYIYIKILKSSCQKGVVGWCEGAVYLTSLGRPTDIGLQLGKACYPCSG